MDATACRVCAAETPPGHKVCDACWPERALAAGVAARCVRCARPKLVERLAPADATGPLVCADCRTNRDTPLAQNI